MFQKDHLSARRHQLAALVFAACFVVPSPAAAQLLGQPGSAAPPIIAPALQGIVQDIAVEGTQRIEPDSVIAYMVLRPGQPYDPVIADTSLKLLFDTGLFADVRMNWDGSTLTVRVVENPILNQVVFEGNSSISEDNLSDEVQVEPRIVFTRARVQADVQRIIELYRRSGYFAATVEPAIIQRPQNRVDLIFEINEGPTTGVAAINFIGNRIFPDSVLRDQILTTESAWWKFLSTNDNYDPDRLTFDREQLRGYYIARGYADFHVVSAVAELAPDRRNFYITFTVDEGERYNFGIIRIESQIEDLPGEELMSLLSTQTGEIYSAELIDRSIEALVFEAGTRGYVFVDINPRVQRNAGTGMIDLVYVIEEGPRVYVERINVIGNTRTRDEVVRREFRIAEGDAFNRVLVERSRTNVRALGYFAEVTVTEELGSLPDRTVLNVEVQEQPTGELSLGAGYSSQTSFLGDFSYTERNLFGRGQFLRLAVSYSFFQKTYDMRFQEPFFMGLPLLAGLQLYNTNQDFIDQLGYVSDTTAFGILFGFPVSEFGTLSPHYNYQIATLTAGPSAPLLVILSAGRASTSSLGLTYVYNTYDDPFLPTSGMEFSFNQDIAGLGGDLKYLRTVAGVEFYQALRNWDLVGMLRFSAGYISGFDGQPVRINERFFRGGVSFRGFEIAGLGPRDLASRGRASVGGQLFLMSTFEVRLPQFLPERYGVRFGLFNDFGTLGYLRGVTHVCDFAGGTVTNPAGVTTFTPASCVQDRLSPRASTGLSVNWRSPFGPVAIDFGYAYLKKSYDRTQTIQFRAGTNF